ncbi:MAG: hypothetical protein HYU86_09550 [Chloroflexi bacterium]|nr:hypothetical protein [Chloroflexota bacterium]
MIKSFFVFTGLLASLILVACATAAPPPPTPSTGVTATPSPRVIPTATPTPVPFYSGKTIRVIVGYAAGGGYDTYARLIAKHIGKYIPGTPTTVVENMAGAGSLVAANYLYKVAKPDGLTLGTFGEGLVLQQALGAEGIEFDSRKFNWLGAADKATQACAVRTDRGFKIISDAVGAPKPLILGATAPGSNTWDFPKVLEAALGINVKLVGGYDGTAKIRLAAEAGEVEGGCWTWESIKVTWKDALDRGFVKILVHQAPAKNPDLADIPLATDLAKTAEGRQLILLATSPAAMTKPFATHPETPPDRVKILQDAFAKVLKDPELMEEANKAQLEVHLVSAEEVRKLVAEALATPPDVAKKLKEVLK